VLYDVSWKTSEKPEQTTSVPDVGMNLVPYF